MKARAFFRDQLEDNVRLGVIAGKHVPRDPPRMFLDHERSWTPEEYSVGPKDLHSFSLKGGKHTGGRNGDLGVSAWNETMARIAFTEIIRKSTCDCPVCTETRALGRLPGSVIIEKVN